jgi:hypothetical protein
LPVKIQLNLGVSQYAIPLSLFCSGGEILAIAVFAVGIPWTTG